MRLLGLLDPDEDPVVMEKPTREPAVFELSVIVPVRDEARHLGECLERLVQQSEQGFALAQQWEILVVDDGSSDGTRAIALAIQDRLNAVEVEADAPSRAAESSEATGLLLLDAPALESKMRLTGKSNACWTGAQRAQGGRLLFLDADMLCEPGSLSRSLREAERHEAGLLSYLPRQMQTGVAQGLVTPLILSELASIYPPAQINDPAQSLAAANGQFLLVEREAYFAVGGHLALGSAVLEDMALARRMKRSGERLRLRHAPEAVAARAPETTREAVTTWTKNLAGLMPSPVLLAAWRLLDLLLLFALPVLAAGVPHLVFWQRGALLLLWLRSVLRFFSRVARAHAGPLMTTLSPLGLPLFAGLLLRSLWAYRVERRVTWKGRSYDPNRE